MFAGGCVGCILAMLLHRELRRRDMDRIDRELELELELELERFPLPPPPCKEREEGIKKA